MRLENIWESTKYHLENRYTCLLYLCIFLMLISSSEVLACDGWPENSETRYASICYSDERVLSHFIRSLGEKDPVQVRDRIDTIVERVGGLLEMDPSGLHFKIHLFATHEELEAAYLRSGALRIFEKRPVAFYSPRNRTIYVSLDRVTAGVLAHEIAHVLINSRFPTPLPAKLQEILAQYVERHLRDE